MIKFIESAKTVIIAILIFTMLFLWTKNMQLHFPKNNSRDNVVFLESDFWIFTDSTNAHSETVADAEYFSPIGITLVANSIPYSSHTNKELTRVLWQNELSLVKEVFSSSYTCKKDTLETWENALFSESLILIDFADALPYTTICEFDNKTSNFANGELCTVKNLILFPDKNDVVSALVLNDKNEVFSFTSNLDPASSLIYDFNSNNLTAYTVNKGLVETSFNLSKTQNVPAHHKILKTPLALPNIKVENTITSLFDKFYSSERVNNLTIVSDEAITELLTIFEINPSTVGVYTDANSKLIFINSNTRLAIGSKGTIEYAVSTQSDVQISISSLLESERTQFSSFEYLASATKFLNMFKGSFIGDNTDIMLEKIEYENGNTTFYFSYYKNLCKVSTPDNLDHIKLVFNSSGLIKADIIPLVISETQDPPTQNPNVIKADIAESLALSLAKSDIPFDDFRPVYVYAQNNSCVEPIWATIAKRK